MQLYWVWCDIFSSSSHSSQRMSIMVALYEITLLANVSVHTFPGNFSLILYCKQWINLISNPISRFPSMLAWFLCLYTMHSTLVLFQQDTQPWTMRVCLWLFLLTWYDSWTIYVKQYRLDNALPHQLTTVALFAVGLAHVYICVSIAILLPFELPTAGCPALLNNFRVLTGNLWVCVLNSCKKIYCVMTRSGLLMIYVHIKAMIPGIAQ